MKTKTEVARQNKKKKKKKKSYTKIYFFFITIFPWGGALDSWAVTSEDPWSMPLGSPLVGSGRVAKKISILGAFLSLKGSWGDN